MGFYRRPTVTDYNFEKMKDLISLFFFLHNILFILADACV